jgi:hypothetical protein
MGWKRRKTTGRSSEQQRVETVVGEYNMVSAPDDYQVISGGALDPNVDTKRGKKPRTDLAIGATQPWW